MANTNVASDCCGRGTSTVIVLGCFDLCAALAPQPCTAVSFCRRHLLPPGMGCRITACKARRCRKAGMPAKNTPDPSSSKHRVSSLPPEQLATCGWVPRVVRSSTPYVFGSVLLQAESHGVEIRNPAAWGVAAQSTPGGGRLLRALAATTLASTSTRDAAEVLQEADTEVTAGSTRLNPRRYQSNPRLSVTYTRLLLYT